MYVKIEKDVGVKTIINKMHGIVYLCVHRQRSGGEATDGENKNFK
jgi:hypothetical protein